MQDPDASLESSTVSLGNNRSLPSADAVAAAWPDRPPGGMVPEHSEKAQAVSAALLVLGAALLFFVPLGGALLLVSGGLGLAICWEPPITGLATASSITTNASIAIQSQALSSTDH